MDIKRCNGKIYTIRSYETELIYVGSTAEKRLSARFSKHKASYKYYLKTGKKYMTACEILKYSDAYIELVIEVENCTKDELRKIEGQYIREMKCINKRIEGRTQDESRKQYYTENKDKINEQKKEYRDTHKEQYNEYQKKYQIINKDKIKEQSKEYRDTHKEQSKEYQKEYYTDNKDKYKKYYAENKDEIQQQKLSKYLCECGKELSHGNKSRHDKVCKFNSKAI